MFRKIIPENFKAPILLKLTEVPFKPECVCGDEKTRVESLI